MIHNRLVIQRVKHILKMCSHLGDTRQWAERRIWLRRLRFWWKLRFSQNYQIINVLVDLNRRGENLIGTKRKGYA